MHLSNRFRESVRDSRNLRSSLEYQHVMDALLLQRNSIPTYIVFRPLSRDILFCFLAEVLVISWAAQ